MAMDDVDVVAFDGVEDFIGKFMERNFSDVVIENGPRGRVVQDMMDGFSDLGFEQFS